MTSTCIFVCVCSCRCAEPDNPSNKTLEMWSEKNITASAVPWANLTVKVTDGGHLCFSIDILSLQSLSFNKLKFTLTFRGHFIQSFFPRIIVWGYTFKCLYSNQRNICPTLLFLEICFVHLKPISSGAVKMNSCKGN